MDSSDDSLRQTYEYMTTPHPFDEDTGVVITENDLRSFMDLCVLIRGYATPASRIAPTIVNTEHTISFRQSRFVGNVSNTNPTTHRSFSSFVNEQTRGFTTRPTNCYDTSDHVELRNATILPSTNRPHFRFNQNLERLFFNAETKILIRNFIQHLWTCNIRELLSDEFPISYIPCICNTPATSMEYAMRHTQTHQRTTSPMRIEPSGVDAVRPDAVHTTPTDLTITASLLRPPHTPSSFIRRVTSFGGRNVDIFISDEGAFIRPENLFPTPTERLDNTAHNQANTQNEDIFAILSTHDTCLKIIGLFEAIHLRKILNFDVLWESIDDKTRLAIASQNFFPYTFKQKSHVFWRDKLTITYNTQNAKEKGLTLLFWACLHEFEYAIRKLVVFSDRTWKCDTVFVPTSNTYLRNGAMLLYKVPIEELLSTEHVQLIEYEHQISNLFYAIRTDNHSLFDNMLHVTPDFVINLIINRWWFLYKNSNLAFDFVYFNASGDDVIRNELVLNEGCSLLFVACYLECEWAIKLLCELNVDTLWQHHYIRTSNKYLKNGRINLPGHTKPHDDKSFSSNLKIKHDLSNQLRTLETLTRQRFILLETTEELISLQTTELKRLNDMFEETHGQILTGKASVTTLQRRCEEKLREHQHTCTEIDKMRNSLPEYMRQLSVVALDLSKKNIAQQTKLNEQERKRTQVKTEVEKERHKLRKARAATKKYFDTTPILYNISVELLTKIIDMTPEQLMAYTYTLQSYCVVCWAHPRNVIFNCDHFVCCTRCVALLPSYQCPVCRCSITDTRVVHT